MKRRQLSVYVVPGMNGDRFFENRRLVERVEDAEVVVFTGGADINPAIYGKEAHESTFFSSQRDIREIQEYKKMRPDQLAVGLCRGNQLLCGLNGGILVQNVSNHAGGRHIIHNGTGKMYPMTSLHHQMIYPWVLNEDYYDVLYWTDHLSRYYEGDGVDLDVIKNNVEPEITVFHTPDNPVCLGIQGHPEMMEPGPTTELVNDLIYSLLDGTYTPEGAWKMR
jgi:gamma-glutamyl-gamma-aminobutyrate hydrolase PuuD